jgi:uncharacterized protein (TIGR03382 family)
MKMSHRALLVLSGLVLAASAASASPKKDVEYRLDGSVRFGDQVFPTRQAWHHSDEFQSSGARCGSRQPTLIDNIIAASAADCGLNSTTINNEYNDGRTFVIPVVFHVIKRTDGTGNISEALLKSQIDILNEDFNAIAGTPGSMGTNAKFLFVLAKRDPLGNPTTGIEYVTNNTYFNDPGSSGANPMKQALKWDPTRYFNIYTNDAGGGGTLGYATFPAQEAGGPEDGVVLNYVYVGRNAPGGAPFDQGRTATHEVGHYFGLFHTFQSGCGTGYTAGDRINDTHPEAQPNFGCTAGTSSGCAGGGLAPIENYMDYSDDTCMTKFTPEQVNRMRCSIVNYRWVNTPPTAGFTFAATGLDVAFTSTSTDSESMPAALTYSWDFGDGQKATQQNPMHTYAAAGTYTVKLEVLDTGSGTATKSDMVMVVDAPMMEPDAGNNTNPDMPDGGDNMNPGGDDKDGGGCCDTSGSGVSGLLLGLPLLGLLLRRRRR